MSEFAFMKQDLFGRYCEIAYGNYGDRHVYKVIKAFRSNCYSDVPLTYETENNPYIHKEVVDVCDVIHCGIDETKVLRVAMKDIKLLPDRRAATSEREYSDCDEFICSKCGIHLAEWIRILKDDDGCENIYEYDFNYCPNCGGKAK